MLGFKAHGVAGAGASVKDNAQGLMNMRGSHFINAGPVRRTLAASPCTCRTDRERCSRPFPSLTRFSFPCHTVTHTSRIPYSSRRLVNPQTLRSLSKYSAHGSSMQGGGRRSRLICTAQGNAPGVAPEDMESYSAAYDGSATNGTNMKVSQAKEGKKEEMGFDLDTLQQTVAALERRQQTVNQQTQDILQVLSAATRVLAAKAESIKFVGLDDLNGEQGPVSTSGGRGQYAKANAELEGGGETIEEEDCVVQHPGALCCTKTHIATDSSGNGAVVTLQTTCRGTEGGKSNGLLTDDYTALATQALADRAAVLSRGAALNVRGVDEANEEVHRSLCDVLQHGTIIDARPNDVVSKFGHPSFIVKLRHKGREVQAIFKPKEKGDGDGWHRASIEWVAYKLNRMLGMDYIPPVAYRLGGVDVDYQHFEEGAFILFVEGVRELREIESGKRGVPLERLLSDTRMLDVLLRNSDRHHGHFLHGEHWAINNSTRYLRGPTCDYGSSMRSRWWRRFKEFSPRVR
mmetsp:Transcript_5711/g.9861  ORF Transcript_5711/g.9861 Transcript_5711/m.9861 type:complete len:517 (-) Transcript_5711:206-1756(-)